MYLVSPNYITALHSGLISTSVEGTMTLTNGQVINITDADIVPGSFSIDNKAINNDDFGLGGIYVGKLSITLMKNIDRYSLYDAEVEFNYYLNYPGGTREEIPLGIYYVSEAKRTKKLISLTCYDSMTDFDKQIPDITTGFAYDVLDAICDDCEVTLGMTEEEVEELPNSAIQFTLNPDNLGTYREAISIIAKVLGCFATINRSGELVLRPFMTTSCGTVTAGVRTDSSVVDYETYFGGIKARFLADSNYYPYSEIDPESDGLTLDIGDIPIIINTDTVKRQVLIDLLEVIETIRYVPSEVQMVSDPSIDLGDCLTLQNVNNTQTSVITIITSFTWVYHSKHRIKSVGSDVKLHNVQTQESRIISQIEGIVSKKEVVVHSYTNSSPITIGGTETTVINIPFVATEAVKPIFVATVPFNMTADGNVIVKYYLDNVLLSDDTITEYLPSGNHFLTFTTNIQITTARTCVLRVSMQTAAVQSNQRLTDAKITSILNHLQNGTEIGSFAVDNTIPSITIPRMGIKAVIFAQGLASTAPWDGTITVADVVSAFDIVDSVTSFGTVAEVLSITKPTSRTNGINESVSGFSIVSGMTFGDASETISVTTESETNEGS